MAGGAPAIDANNNLYVITGNDDFNADSASAPNQDYGDSFLRLNSALSIMDYFSPSNQGSLDGADLDLGSGGAVVLVDLPAPAPHQHLLIGGGKGSSFNGEVFVLDRDNLGKFNSSTNNIVQIFALGGGIFSTAAFWQNTLYMAGVGQTLKAFTLNASSSLFNATPGSQSSHSYQFPGGTPSVSSLGSTAGTEIVWALDTNATSAPNASGVDGPAVLYAYDALTLSTQLYRSDTTVGATNAAGNAVKFCVPAIANGKVYVGTQTELTVFGLLP